MRMIRFRPSKERLLSAFVLTLRLGLGFLFIVSSIPKIRQPYMFLGSVYGYELVGAKTGVLVAMLLPWAELFTGVCLVGGVFVGGALLASLGMGVLFTFVLASALWRQLDISCGCFSSSAAGKISYMTLVRAIAITLLSAGAYAAAIFLSSGEGRPVSPAPKPARDPQTQPVQNDTGFLLPQE